MPTISAIIIAKNEERHIRKCIETVLWTDEIIVLDSGSTDHTSDICKEYAPKVKLYITDWPGYGKQKNRASTLATSDWILSLDADEQVTPELKTEILQAINSDRDYAAYQIPFQNHFHNQPIRHCFGSDFHTRLVKQKLCKFSDTAIHEKMIIAGKTGRLREKINHFSVENIEELIYKMNLYSTLGASNLYQTSKKTNPLKILVHASWVFIKIYFLRLGFLDGWPGLVMAFSNYAGTFYKYAKLLEKNSEIKK